MQVSNNYYKEYGELSEYDNISTSSVDDNSGSSSSSSSFHDNTTTSSSKFSSEISMDLSDLQEALSVEEDRRSRITPGSMYIDRKTTGESHFPQHYLASVQEEEYSNYSETSGTIQSTLKLDKIPEDCFQNNMVDSLTLCCSEEKINCLAAVKEQDKNERFPKKQQLHCSTNDSKRKVKFESGLKLEEIQEFDKHRNEDYYLLWYTAHELQKMIDNNRAEELLNEWDDL